MTIKARLALWFAGGTIAVVLAVAIVSVVLLRRSMRSQVDRNLRGDLKRVLQHLEDRRLRVLTGDLERYPVAARDGERPDGSTVRSRADA